MRELAPGAARGYPVRLRGVATFYHAAQDELFLQDGSGGVLVRSGNALKFEAGVGQLLEVEGSTGSGIAEVLATRVELIGEGPMPPVRRVTQGQLAAGELRGCWVETRGVVHALQLGRTDGLLGLEFTTGRTVLMALIKDYNLEDCRRLVDAEVLIAGVLFQTKAALLELRVPFMGDIAVIQPAPVDPFAAPAFAVEKILAQVPEGLEHRVRIDGLVTLQQPGQAVFVQSGTNFLVALSEQKTLLQTGDIIELVGFASMSRPSNLRLEHAIFRKTGRSSQPNPIPITAEEAATAGREAALVSLEGTLLRRERRPVPTLQLQSCNVVFRARLANAAREFPGDIRDGCRLHLTGICLGSAGAGDAQHVFDLLLRSPRDVVLLKPVRSFNQQVTGAIAGVGGLLALVLAWRFLRKKPAKA